MVFGIRAVIEAIKSGQEIESLYVQRGLKGEIFHELKQLMQEYQLSAQQVPVEKLNRLTPKNHQGVVAFISPITYQKIEDIIPAIYENGETPLILMLDGVTDVRKPGRLVVVAENHSVVGGLGEAVASLLLREGVAPAKFRMLALPDEFLDAGALPTLHDRYGISAEKMAASIKSWLV